VVLGQGVDHSIDRNVKGEAQRCAVKTSSWISPNARHFTTVLDHSAKRKGQGNCDFLPDNSRPAEVRSATGFRT